jgi:hypothetical protein
MVASQLRPKLGPGAGMAGAVELHTAALSGNDASFNHYCRTIVSCVAPNRSMADPAVPTSIVRELCVHTVSKSPQRVSRNEHMHSCMCTSLHFTSSLHVSFAQCRLRSTV